MKHTITKVFDAETSERIQRLAFAKGFHSTPDKTVFHMYEFPYALWLEEVDPRRIMMRAGDEEMNQNRVCQTHQMPREEEFSDDWEVNIVTPEEMIAILDGVSLVFNKPINSTCSLHGCMEAFYNEGSF